MEKESLQQQAYSIIKEKIINCEYMPNSTLSENFLCEATNSSRTPVREALRRLEHERLITVIPKTGILVNQISINEINMIFEARCLVEPFVIRNYAQTLDSLPLLELYSYFSDKYKTEDAYKVFKTDDAFHTLLISACKNVYLKQMYTQTALHNSRLRIFSGKTSPKRLHETSQEHVKVLDYLLKREFSLAADAMYLHLSEARNATFKLVLSNSELGNNL